MADSDNLFKNRRLLIDRLEPFGFSPGKKEYIYSTGLIDDQFKMTVAVTEEGAVSAELIDKASNEFYVLHRVSGARGPFAARVREEYLGVLEAIAGACFEPAAFTSAGARMVIAYVRKKYRNELEFLWQRFAGNAIFRRQDSGKWYAALLTVQKSKMGFAGEGEIEVIDLRGEPNDVSAWVNGKRYFPGYHMNKKHWFTICFDGSVPVKEIFRRIDESFALAGK